MIADWDGYEFRLYLNNGEEDKNEIILEPETIKALLCFIQAQDIKID